MPMLRTTKIAVIAVSMINPVRSLEVRALRPAQSNSICIQPLLALMVAASCFNSGLTGWSILLSHENITLVPSTRFFCALTARGLGFTNLFCGARFRRFRRLLPPRVSFCSSGRRTIETVTSTPSGRCMMRNHDFVSDGFPAVIAASLVLLCSGWLAIAFS